MVTPARGIVSVCDACGKYVWGVCVGSVCGECVCAELCAVRAYQCEAFT